MLVSIKNKETINFGPREDTQMANRYTPRCLTLVMIKDLQIKAIMRYHLTPVRMASSSRQEIKKCQRKYTEKRIQYTDGEYVNWYSHRAIQHKDSSKVKNRTSISSITLMFGYTSKGNEDRILKRYPYSRVYSLLFTTAKT